MRKVLLATLSGASVMATLAIISPRAEAADVRCHIRSPSPRSEGRGAFYGARHPG